MRKIRHFFLTTAAVLCSTLTTWAEPYNGTPATPSVINDGEFDGYYAIGTAEELYGFAALVNGGRRSANAVLTANIVVNENVLNADGTLNGTPTYSWTPIGTFGFKYAGTFDGNGHTISGLYFDNTTYENYPDGGINVGLIGRANGATIKNVGVIDSYLKGYEYVGGICGYGLNTNITNCYNTGMVTGNSDYVGGICGCSGTITSCYNTGTVTGSGDYIGGICGSSGTQTNCYNSGTVRGIGSPSHSSYYVGGICGDYGTQTNCYNIGKVSGLQYVGGICGKYGTQSNCYYLAGCGNNALGVSATAEEFTSGKITYLLNGSTSGNNNAWRQNLDNGAVDAYPVLDKNHNVVYATLPCTSGFSNSEVDVKEHSPVDATGHCTDCGQLIAKGTLVTNSNYSDLNLTADFVGYYAISNSAELYWFAKEANSRKISINAVLTADIVVNENVLNDDGTLNGTPTYSWTPIVGTSPYNYAGTFDGNGHTISGLYFNDVTNSAYPNGGNYVGLIGFSNGATIKNVGVIDSYISGHSNVGGICGFGYDSRTKIINCYNTGTVSCSYSNAGGICGSCHTYTKITNCYNTGIVSGREQFGGICGYGGTKTNCYYLAGCCSVSGGGFSATAEEFGSGKVTYLLNSSPSEGLVWRQTLDNSADPYPVLDRNHGVVYITRPCTSEFSNTFGVVKEHPSMDKTGRCTACGKFIAQEATLVTESNYSALNLTADFIGYYAISSTTDLYWLANEVNNGNTTINTVLTADIVVNENVLNADGTLNGTPTYGWLPIGTSSKIYAGTFDGNGHTISGLYFNNITDKNYPDGGENVGLIGYANGATIKNVGVIDSYIKGYSYIGGICGYSYDSNTNITNCYNTGTVSGSYYSVGGICGGSGTQTNCYNTGTIIGNEWYVGGICGANGTQTYCYNSGTVSGSANVGGICGVNGTQTNCYNTGTISGYYVGGICGYSGDGTQTNCYNIGTVSGSNYVGGITGGWGTQTNCYYLAGSGSGSGGGVSATAAEFASGKIGYLLNKDNNNAWYQDLYSDGYPLLDDTHNLVSGYIEEVDDTYTVVGEMFLATNYEVAEGKTLNVPAGTSLTTTGNAVITNNGTIICNGTLAGNNLAGNGTFITNRLSLCSISNLNESYVYKSTAYTLEDGLSGVAVNTTILGKTFTLNASYSAPAYTNNRYVGTATISWTNTADANDVLSGQFEITPKEINLVWSNAQFTYNRTAQAPSATATGMVGNDACEVTVSGAQTNAGSYTATAESLSNTNYKLPEDKTKAFNISPKTITVTATAESRVYDSSIDAEGSLSTADIVSGDNVTISYANAEFNNKNVGTGKVVTFSGITIGGTAAANYALSSTSVTANANITAKGLNLSNFAASDKTYDGTTNSTGGAFSDDRVSGDALEFSFDYAFANMNAADAVAVNFRNIAISGGADKDNYSLLTTTGTCNAKISPVTDEVAITITLADKSVVYSGAEQTYNAADALTIEADNALYNLDWVSESGNAASVSGTNAGEYAFGWNAEMFSNSSPNFTNVTFNVTDGKLIITPNTNVVVTITENSKETAYNTEEQSVSGYSVDIEDETNVYSETDFTFSGNAVAAGTIVGTYPMDLSAADFSNTNTNFANVRFEIVDGALTINKAAEAPNKPAATMETRYIVTQLVALPENWKWADEQQTLEKGNNTATANYTGADKGNYVIESVDVTIKRLDCLHNEGNELLYTLEPTCTHKGYTGNLSCKLCGEIYEMGDSIPALGHDFVNTVIAPTCTTEGYTEHFCNRCQHIEYSDTVAATGHKADSVVFENVVAATCTAAGSYDSVVYCSVCKIELSRDAVDVAAAGHKADSVAIENIVAATRTAAGSYDSVVYCSVCKVELSRTTVKVPQIVAETIKLASKPNKVDYKQGEALDVKGGKITIGYSDKSTEDFEILSGWVSGFDSQKVGKQTLTVKFEAVSSPLTTTFDVTVSAKDDDNTAIDEDAANKVNIYAYQNVIVVENANAEIYVYDAMGRLVERNIGNDSRTEIRMNNAGVYIVKVGNAAKRVITNN